MEDEKNSVIGFWQVLLVVMMCVFGWCAYTWLVFDIRTAQALQSSLPAWFFAVPVVIGMLGWLVLGLGTVVLPFSRQYVRFRCALMLWIFSCVIGFGVVVYGLIAEPGMYRIGGILIAGGLALHALILIMLVFKQPPGTEAIFSHIHSTLLFVAAFSISAGVQQGFVYRFPGFVLGLASFLFLVTGIIEILNARPGFTRLSCLWKGRSSGSEPSSMPQVRSWWKFHGVVMLLCAVFFSGVLLNNTFTILPRDSEDTRTVMLNIRAGEAWTWITEPSHVLMWQTDFTEYIIPDMAEERVGTAYYLIGEQNGERFAMECVITQWVHPHEFSFRGSLPGYDVQATYVIEHADDGSVVTCTEMYVFRNLRARIEALPSGRRPALQSLEQRLKNLQEVTGMR